jgi:hypothetical protein
VTAPLDLNESRRVHQRISPPLTSVEAKILKSLFVETNRSGEDHERAVAPAASGRRRKK